MPPQPWTTGEDGRSLLSALDAASGRTRLVGGAVRDALTGRATSDIDLATEFAPDDVMARLQKAGLKAIPTGLAHGTVTAVADDLVAEVTTLRRDVTSYGRHADVAFTDDWREDARRRDFTFNAMNAFLPEGAVTDYFGGLDDLKAGRVRFIGDAYERIAEDHLRILRFFRFHARFGEGQPDTDGLDACTARANDLMALSRERVAQELLKLLAAAKPSPTMGLMVAHGVWRPVLPEFTPAGTDRLERLVKREDEAGLDGDPLRRLAAALPPDPETGLLVAKRLKLSKAQQLRTAKALARSPSHSFAADAYYDGLETALDRALLGDMEPEEIAARTSFVPPVLPIKGRDLIARGLAPGPEVSERLKRFETMWVEAGFPDDTGQVDALIARALS
ncbi:polynucleotide adenylyltransferase [Pacificimonas flava]|uniref:Polynucleotide adenylyltransferase n=2 Tax=Pacificimonas TaxID=1960290 RepID=A0A219B9H6_9SPHN|nr:CCA tRNA nucleotidyltransferase [Pacificimonas aurantium]OWV34776.1 polynucleotide adenylyltransferase [Pacificimonas flava]